MARGPPSAGLWPVAIVVLVLLSGVVLPAQPAAARTDDARTFSPPPGAADVDPPVDRGATSTGPGSSDAFASTGSALRPTAGPHVDPLPGHGSLVDRLAGGVGVPLGAVLLGYSRHVNEEPLANEVRRRVNAQVRATPGAHIAAIVGAIDVSRSTVRYHLDVLEEAGLITGEMIRGKHRYAPAGEDLATAAALYDGPAREVLDSVARFEPAGVTFLAEEVDRAPSTVSHHLDRLVEVGLLERERADGRVLVSLTPAADRHLERESPAVTGDGPRVELSLD